MKANHPDTRTLRAVLVRTLRTTALPAAAALLATSAAAHTQLDGPNGGEVLYAGSTVTIEWQVTIEHQLIDWNLDYSTSGPSGPWIPIATGLPAGDPTAGVPHYYDWVVPDTPSGQVRVRVEMNNVNVDYLDESDADLTIAPAAATGYCSGKLNSLGCVPFLTYEGAPSATASEPFRLTARDVVAGQNGLLLYGLTGKASLPFHNGTLCVKAPVVRLLPLKTAKGGGGGACPGRFQTDFNKRVQSGADPRLSVGATVHAQWLYRDPGVDAFNDGLTDGMRFVIQP